MAVFKDIDISFELTSKNDFGIITDRDSIKNTLFNNLNISPNEYYFDDSNRLDISDALHDVNDYISRKQITDGIIDAIRLDPRINTLEDISFDFDDVLNTITITILLSLNITIEDDQNTIEIGLIFEKS